MTFAHEVGHNMGAEHDEDAGCSSGFIMSKSGSTKVTHTEQRFSNCSINAIHTKISSTKTDKRPGNCFRNLKEDPNDEDFSICGNHQVEGDEECDCGMSYQTCGDPCCYAAHISPKDLAWNQSAVPCRKHESPICLQPFRYFLIFQHCAQWAK